MRSSFAPILVATAALLAVAGCDVRPLQQGQLSGIKPGSPDGGPDRGPSTTGTDAVVEAGPDVVVDTTPEREAGAGCAGVVCQPFESCDTATLTCKLRSGPGMLSGAVVDACRMNALTAQVGIAGRRTCSSDGGKGAYYFVGLPEGDLALIAFKEGYRHFDTQVTITATGTVRNILLVPDTPGGCADPPPADVPCVCAIAGCF